MPLPSSVVPPDLRFATDFWDSVRSLTKDEQANVRAAVTRYAEAPDLPGLNLKKLKATRSAVPLWSIRASKELRILLQREGRLSTLLYADHHDDAHARAERIEPAVASGTAQATAPLREGDQQPADEQHPDPPRSRTERHSKPAAFAESPIPQAVPSDGTPRPWLWMWSATDLIEALGAIEGIDISIHQAQRLVNATEEDFPDTIESCWPTDTETPSPDRLLDLLVELLPTLSPAEWRAQQLSDAEAAAVERFARDITERGAASALSIALNPDEVRRLAAAPIEDWMIFLHPAQQNLVERHFSGPARVSGSAGTGKTTVALHRAAWLAKHPPERALFDEEALPILFTTFIRSLPPVLASLYRRLPTAVDGPVEFTNVDELAHKLCQESYVHSGSAQVNVDIGRTKNLFARAKRDVIRPGSPLHALGVSDEYLRDEVTKVIIGRDIADLATYRDVRRHGRDVPFRQPVRDQMWELHVAWRNLMADRNLEHFEDRIRRARDYVRSLPQARFRAVLIDESQDLTQVGLELLSALVAERIPAKTGDGHDLILKENSMLIVGDAAQRVYPGGFALTDAGVEVRGRSEVLGVNYRNTRQIIEAAMACTGSQEVADASEGAVADMHGDARDATSSAPSSTQPRRRADAARETRHDEGVTPRLVIAANQGEERQYVAEEIPQLASKNAALSLGDFGVFAATNEQVEATTSLLERAGLTCINLKQFAGAATDEIRVGTFDRAKGLEFKVVFLLGVSHGAWPFTAPSTLPRDERADAEALAATKLFVAMTRARDALYVVCSEKPHSLIDAGRDHFETIHCPTA